MYRQGLGDCFLVTFGAESNERHLLIDCGTLGATTTSIKMADVVKDIRDSTHGHLHLLVATHEHKDHVSGFRDRQATFAQIAVDEVWLAWTENPGDSLAQKLARKRQDLGLAAARCAAALRARPGTVAQAVGLAIDSVLGFFDDPERLGAGTFSPTVDEAMDLVRARATPRFLEPGEGPIELPAIDGFRFYVLGPPRDEAALDEIGEHGSSELYGIAAALACPAEFFASGKPARDFVVEADPDTRASFESALPFDARFRMERGSEAARRLFADSYCDDREGWRTVDDDWLRVASDIALQLDNATNNTSLVLAIERIADGKVLLFPADAQQGSWKSWHAGTMRWTVQDGDRTSTVSAADLLARTVFYKVGHHASHNATASGLGLELMTSDELTAFIPVDRDVALKRHPQGAWRMPAPALYRRLMERCQGRVVRSDLGWADDASKAPHRAVEKEFVDMATRAEWSAWKTTQQAATRVHVEDLYIDYLLA